MSQTNGAAVLEGGLSLADHEITAARMHLIEELIMVMADELAEVYGNASDYAGVAHDALSAVQALRRALALKRDGPA